MPAVLLDDVFGLNSGQNAHKADDSVGCFRDENCATGLFARNE
jgi:hypothetical protein